MLLLPVLAIFVWIFLVGLINDWRSEPDDEPAQGSRLARLLLPRVTRIGERIADAIADGLAEQPADQPAGAAAIDPYPTELASGVLPSGVLAGHDAVDIQTAT